MGVAIMLTVLAINSMGNLLSEVIDPRRQNEKGGALKTQVQHFVGENVAWEKVTAN